MLYLCSISLPYRQISSRLQSGFTAIEFLLMMAVFSIVFVSLIAGASQRNERWLTDDSARNLQLSMAFARNQAITRRSSIRVCPASDQLECADLGDWNTGWLVLDTESGEVIRLIEPGPGEVRVYADSGVSRYVQFNELGDAFSTAGEFVFCHQDQTDYAMGIQVSAVGLVQQLEADSTICSS